MALPEYKVEVIYKDTSKKSSEFFFQSRAFETAYKQAMQMINHNLTVRKSTSTYKLFWKNIYSQYNFGWKWQGTFSN